MMDHAHHDLQQEIFRIWGVLRQFTSGLVTPATGTMTTSTSTRTVVCDSALAMTVNLHAAVGSGQRITVKSINVGAVTVDADGAETIDGAPTFPLAIWDRVTVVDYAVGAWAII
jgi:hypothetical protein